MRATSGPSASRGPVSRSASTSSPAGDRAWKGRCRPRPSSRRGALFERVGFDEGLNRYVDLDWLLRAERIEGFALVFVPGAPLSVYSIDERRARISNEPDWRRDVAWIRERRHLVTRRAYGGYLLTQASIRAERSRDRSAFFPLLREALTSGRVSLGEVVFHTGNTFLPADLRLSLTSVAKGG